MSSLSSSGAASRASGSRTDLHLVSLAALLWGTGGLAGTLLGQVAALPPLAVATYRLGGGGLALLAVLAVTRRLRRPSRAGLVRVLVVGGLVAAYQTCYFASVALTSLAVATVVAIGAAPVLVVTVEAVLDRRRPGTASLVAIALALLGLALLVGSPRGGSAAGASAGAASASASSASAGISGGGGGALVVGVVLALGAAAGFGALALLGRRPVADLDGPTTIGFGFTSGGLLLAVVGSAVGGLGFTPTLGSVGLLLYLGWVPTALAYGLFFVGLRGVSATSAAVVAVLEPLTATVLGVLVLGQRPGLGGIAGAGLLCAAAVLAGLRGSAGTAPVSPTPATEPA
ncbi:MAG TPA: DMT family transporter [Pseudonocardia sp.]|nr:DMT family transporter [Pseudonocardia sp.]